MTKEEAIAKIEFIEGMTGSRATAFVNALDALGLLALATRVSDLSGLTVQPIDKDADYADMKAKLDGLIGETASFREIKNKVGVTAPSEK